MVQLTSPWVTYYRRLQALFAGDEEVSVIYTDGDKPVVKLYVTASKKYKAIVKYIPDEVEFGNVTLEIQAIPANTLKNIKGNESAIKIDDLFEGNDALSYIQNVTVFDDVVKYVVFDKEVVQYFTDNMADLYGLSSALMQDIADEIVNTGEEMIYFCTNPRGDCR